MIEKIRAILDSILNSEKKILGYSLINSDGIGILTSFNQQPDSSLNTAFLSLFKKNSYIVKKITSENIKRIFIKFEKRNLLILSLTNVLFIVLEFDREVTPAIITLSIKNELRSLDELLREY